MAHVIYDYPMELRSSPPPDPYVRIAYSADGSHTRPAVEREDFQHILAQVAELAQAGRRPYVVADAAATLGRVKTDFKSAAQAVDAAGGCLVTLAWCECDRVSAMIHDERLGDILRSLPEPTPIWVRPASYFDGALNERASCSLDSTGFQIHLDAGVDVVTLAQQLVILVLADRGYPAFAHDGPPQGLDAEALSLMFVRPLIVEQLRRAGFDVAPLVDSWLPVEGYPMSSAFIVLTSALMSAVSHYASPPAQDRWAKMLAEWKHSSPALTDVADAWLSMASIVDHPDQALDAARRLTRLLEEKRLGRFRVYQPGARIARYRQQEWRTQWERMYSTRELVH